jgi:hypothetical protein
MDHTVPVFLEKKPNCLLCKFVEVCRTNIALCTKIIVLLARLLSSVNTPFLISYLYLLNS